LKQRNAALKARQPKALLGSWDHELVPLGDFITSARARYVLSLGAIATGIAQRLLGLDLKLSYRPGWARALSFGEALAAALSHDQEAGITQVGPHRAELSIRLNGSPVREHISRGQQKLLASALLLAQLSLLPRESGVNPTLLLDDPAAELDAEKLAQLITEVSTQDVQLLVTSLDSGFSAFGAPGRRYSIVAGRLTPS
jgi:DNA replication and repair protein RecF